MTCRITGSALVSYSMNLMSAKVAGVSMTGYKRSQS